VVIKAAWFVVRVGLKYPN